MPTSYGFQPFGGSNLLCIHPVCILSFRRWYITYSWRGDWKAWKFSSSSLEFIFYSLGIQRIRNVASFPGPRAHVTLASCGLGTFCPCMMRRVVEGLNFCVGEDSCSSQTTKEGSESILLLATLRSLFVP